MRKDYIREHSKFIHSSWCILEDLDKKVEMYGKTYRIAGLWDVIGFKKQILLAAENGTYAHVDSQEVANALGYTKFRNLVTGKEITYDLAADYRLKKANKISVIPAEVYEDEETVSVINEIDEDAIVQDEDDLIEDELGIYEESDEDINESETDEDSEDIPTTQYREDDYSDEDEE
jgi:hypothetical protein